MLMCCCEFVQTAKPTARLLVPKSQLLEHAATPNKHDATNERATEIQVEHRMMLTRAWMVEIWRTSFAGRVEEVECMGWTAYQANS